MQHSDSNFIIQLHQILGLQFDEEELRTLCVYLRVDYGSLQGKERTGKARELISYFDKQGQISKLVDIGQQIRPDVSWPIQPKVLETPPHAFPNVTPAPIDMKECPSCGHLNHNGLLFCAQCGVYLPSGGPLRTRPLPQNDLPVERAYPWSTDTERNDNKKHYTLNITLVDSGRQVKFPAASEIDLGRLDGSVGVFPDLNLTAEGLDLGVSRRHAKIRFQENRFYIEDVGSLNGSFLNGKRLTTHLAHLLRDGDRLQLGNLQLVVNFD